MMRILAISLAAISVGACDGMVTSERPLFAAADSQGAPLLKDGVWAVIHEPGCQIDAKAELTTWPKCAEPLVVEGGRLTQPDAGRGERLAALLLVAGDPPMIQVDDTVGADSSGAVVYAGLRPAQIDAKGAAAAFDLWVVLCVPPEKAHAPSVDPKDVLPGFNLTARGDCSVDDPDKVREAARASEAWPSPDGRAQAHWVRGGRR